MIKGGVVLDINSAQDKDLKKSSINLIGSAGDSSNLDREKISAVLNGIVKKTQKSWLRLSTNLSTKRSTMPLRRMFD